MFMYAITVFKHKCVVHYRSILLYTCTDEAFKEQRFQWEIGASAGVDFLTFKICYRHKNLYKTEVKEKNMKT